MRQKGYPGQRAELAQKALALRAAGHTGIAIGEILGVSRTYAYELINDPTGEKNRQRKAQYDGTCIDCGGRTVGDGRRSGPPKWFGFKRPYNHNGAPAHSAKPEGFLDVVEQVSPGPYLEIFARRARFGWEYAGDGSLGTVTIPGLRGPGETEQAA